MYSNKAESDRLVASILLAENSGQIAGNGFFGMGTCNSSDNRLSSNSDLSHAPESERQETNHHLAILVNSIFAAAGC